jgi:pseudouridine synthase
VDLLVSNLGKRRGEMNRLQTPPAARGLVRLQKAMADAGVAARRDCEQLIVAGRVRVNGTCVTELPCFIDPQHDVVELDGVALSLPEVSTTAHAAQPRQHVYVLLNKPKGVITTTADPQGRRSVLDLLPPALRREERLFPVGRLDADSTGLLLITNDGDLAFQLTHPKFGIAKQYRVTCRGLATEEQLEILRKGLYLVTPDGDGAKTTKRASMESVRILKRQVDRARGDRSLLSITLREGQNREIRRLLAHVGLKVKELQRVAIGPLRLTDLAPGACKLLSKRDVEKLRSAALAPAQRGRRVRS